MRALGRVTSVAAFRAAAAVLLVLWAASWSVAATLTVSWSPPAPVDVILVERGPGQSGPFSQIAQTGAGAVSWSDGTVNTGTTYCYRVRARNAAGTSGYSPVACGSVSAPAPPPPASAAIAYVQGTSVVTPQTPQSTVTARFPVSQKAGNLNVIIVGWSDTTASVSTVTDSRGNSYQLAVGPTRSGTAVSQSIYYAKAIVGGDTTVTVRFTTPARYADIRVLEYSGVDTTSPLLASATGAGTSTAGSTGNLTTSVAKALLVAGNVVTTGTAAAGSGYTVRMWTPHSDIAGDRVVAAGQYSASATLTSTGTWVMQVVAFKSK